MFGDLYVVFGGDRHHMPFNDLHILDLASEFEDQTIGQQKAEERVKAVEQDISA